MKIELTTVEAGKFLGVSPQFLMELLERGEIPFHMVGSHRRMYARDVPAYKSAMRTAGRYWTIWLAPRKNKGRTTEFRMILTRSNEYVAVLRFANSFDNLQLQQSRFLGPTRALKITPARAKPKPRVLGIPIVKARASKSPLTTVNRKH